MSVQVLRASIATAAAVCCLGAPALAQQYTQETTTRLPNPGPIDYSNQATLGDLDNDGDLDLIFANGGNFSTPGTPQRQKLYINDGNGFFFDESGRIDSVSLLARGVELGDIERDGDLDIIFVQDFNRQPQLFVNDGTGDFTNETATRLPQITLASSRGQFGDVDNDGDLDLYITSGSTTRFSCGQYRLYLNDGNGFFTDATATNLPQQNVCNNMDCIFGDIDGDFDIDIRTSSTGSNNSRLYRNDGTGVFTQISAPADNSCYSYDFGDINGDGAIDLLGANGGSGNSEILLLNDGNGGFSNISGNINPNPSQDDNDSKFVDYDNDGDLDLFIGRLGGTAEKVYNNNGSGVFTQVSGVMPNQGDSTLDIMAGDVDNDGDYDIITAQGESGNYTNRIYINNGPADTIPPTIVDTEQLADTDDNDGPYVVRVAVLDSMTSDRNFFDKGITLHYSVNGGDTQQVDMLHSGGQIYRGEIPGVSGGLVEYFVTAIDWADNMSTGETLSFTVEGAPIDPADFDMDGDVDAADLAALLGAWGPCEGCPQDLDGDGVVGPADLAILLGAWG